MGHQHGVEGFITEPGEPGHAPDRLVQLDLRRAVAGKRLGEPTTGPLPIGDTKGPHFGGKHPPSGQQRILRRSVDTHVHRTSCRDPLGKLMI